MTCCNYNISLCKVKFKTIFPKKNLHPKRRSILRNFPTYAYLQTYTESKVKLKWIKTPSLPLRNENYVKKKNNLAIIITSNDKSFKHHFTRCEIKSYRSPARTQTALALRDSELCILEKPRFQNENHGQHNWEIVNRRLFFLCSNRSCSDFDSRIFYVGKRPLPWLANVWRLRANRCWLNAIFGETLGSHLIQTFCNR